LIFWGGFSITQTSIISSCAPIEYYTYDGVYRLVNTDYGNLNGNKDGIDGTPDFEKQWTLDATGNSNSNSGDPNQY